MGHSIDLEKVINEAFDEAITEVWYDDDYFNIGYNNGLEEGRRIALALLKEQEPKPVKVVKNAYNHEFYYCPRCDHSFYGVFKRPNYCDECGQAVKWE